VSVISSNVDSSTLVTLPTRAGELCVRDAIAEDVDAFVSYWHESGDAHLQFLGIDRAKLGTVEDTRKRFLEMRRQGPDQASIAFTITLNGVVIGYTNINRYGPNDNYPHLHTYRSSVKSAAQFAKPVKRDNRAGVAGALIGSILEMHFRLFPIRRLVLQTRTRNKRINGALDLYLPVAETRHFDNPDGVAGPGEFHVRYASNDDAHWLLARSQSLANGAESHEHD